MKVELLFYPHNNFQNFSKDDIRGFLKERFEVVNSYIKFDEGNVQFVIQSPSNNNFIKFIVVKRGDNKKNARLLSEVRDSFKNESIRKKFYITRLYDGPSIYYGKFLYPKILSYELKIRTVINLVLFHAFGDKWIEEAINRIDDKLDDSKKIKNSIKRRTNGRIKIDSLIDEFTFSQYNSLIFTKYPNLTSEEIICEMKKIKNDKQLSPQLINHLLLQSEEKSLWDRFFSNKDSSDYEKELIKIRDIRNKIMHGSVISENNYKYNLKILNSANKRIDNVLSNVISQREFINPIDMVYGNESNNNNSEFDMEKIQKAIQKVMSSLNNDDIIY